MLAIILINYNGWSDTIECIESIKQSEFKDYVIYLVDNASLDDSVVRLERYISKTKEKIVLIKSSVNLGFSGGNNLGIMEAKKDNRNNYFLLLNNDTLIEPSSLEELLKPFANERVDATIGKIYYAYEKTRLWYAGGILNEKILKPIHIGFNELDEGLYNEQKEVSFATGCCVCLSRNCIETIGLWSEDYFLYEEDVDYSYRIARGGHKIIYVPKAIIYHKVSSSTAKTGSLAELYQVRNRLILIRKYKHGISALFAYAVTFMIFMNRIIKREYKIKPMYQGISAFLKGEYGKHEGAVD